MGKRGDELAGGRIPELGATIRACRKNPSAVRTKRRIPNRSLVVKGGDEFSGGRIPQLSGFVPA